MSSTITDILSAINDPSVSAAKSELIDLISTAESDAKVFIQSNAQQLQNWLAKVKSGEMSQDEFDELVAAQKIVARNFALGQEEAARERTERLTIHVLELAAEKIVPALLMAAL
jgi:arsenate reductase-like glutaredoxin family protein